MQPLAHPSLQVRLQGKGTVMIAKIFQWFTHASYDDSSIQEWVAGLALVLIFAFLWSTVVRQVVEPAAEVIGEAV